MGRPEHGQRHMGQHVVFKQVFPSFHLEDALVVEGRRDVMTGIAYHRHKRKPAPEASACALDATPTPNRAPHAAAMPTN
jgi:hypothetical protein